MQNYPNPQWGQAPSISQTTTNTFPTQLPQGMAGVDTSYFNQYQPSYGVSSSFNQPDNRFSYSTPPIVPSFGYFPLLSNAPYPPGNSLLNASPQLNSNQQPVGYSKGYLGKKPSYYENVGVKRKFESHNSGANVSNHSVTNSSSISTATKHIGKNFQGSKFVNKSNTNDATPSKAAASIDPNRYPCRHCLRSFKTDEGLLAHMKIVHKSVELEATSGPLETTSEKVSDSIDSDQKMPYVCDDTVNCNHQCLFCKRTFKFIAHSVEKNETAVVCNDEQFADVKIAQKITKSNSKLYGCKLCNKVKPSFTGLQHHLLIKHPQLFTSFIILPSIEVAPHVQPKEGEVVGGCDQELTITASSDELQHSVLIEDDNNNAETEGNDSQLDRKANQSLSEGIMKSSPSPDRPCILSAQFPTETSPTDAPFYFDCHAEEIAKIVEVGADDDSNLVVNELRLKKEKLKQQFLDETSTIQQSVDIMGSLEGSRQTEENASAAQQLLNNVESVAENMASLVETLVEGAIRETLTEEINARTSLASSAQDTTNKDSSFVFDGAAFPCSKCKKMCKSSIALNQHYLSKHTNESSNSGEGVAGAAAAEGSVGKGTTDPVTSAEGLQCPHCDKKMKSDKGLRQHVLMKHQQ